MATLVSNLKQKLYVEDVESGAAASESVMTKVAGTVNLLADTSTYAIHFDIHGPYNIIGVPDNKVDKYYIVPYDAEIYAIHYYLGVNVGSGGTAEVDVVNKPFSGGAEASIFTTRPIIPASAGTESDIIREFLPSVSTIRLATGGTAPALTSTQLSKYDVLKFNMIAKPTGTVDKLGLVLLIRPR